MAARGQNRLVKNVSIERKPERDHSSCTGDYMRDGYTVIARLPVSTYDPGPVSKERAERIESVYGPLDRQDRDPNDVPMDDAL
jgi:hypothetical protein